MDEKAFQEKIAELTNSVSNYGLARFTSGCVAGASSEQPAVDAAWGRFEQALDGVMDFTRSVAAAGSDWHKLSDDATIVDVPGVTRSVQILLEHEVTFVRFITTGTWVAEMNAIVMRKYGDGETEHPYKLIAWAEMPSQDTLHQI